MTDVTADDVMREMRSAVIQAAGSRHPGETIERWLERSARRLGITFARAHNYWHCRVRRVDAHEADNIRNRLRTLAETRLEELRAELAALEGTPIAQVHPSSLGSAQARVLERR